MKSILRIGAAALALLLQLGAAQEASDGAAIVAQLMQQLPSCAVQCTLAEVPKSTCAPTDFACICTNQDLNNQVLICLQQNCTVVEQLQTKGLLNNACGTPIRNIGSRVVAINWVFFGAAIVAVACRLFARLTYFGGAFSWDDYTIAISLLSLLPIAVIAQIMVNNGLGQDIWQLEPDKISNMLFYFFIEEFLYMFLSAVTKISILLLYLNIFKTKAFQIQCYVLIALISGYCISGIVSTGFYCKPLEFVWNGWKGEYAATCININAQTFSMAGINMSIDIAILILPIPLIMGLQMKVAKRIAVVGVFATGLFVTVCSVVRLTTLLKWGKSQNPTYDYAEVAIWSLIELMTGVICACMPGLASLARRLFPRVFGTTKAKSYMNSENMSGNMTSKFSSGKNIQSKTTISVSYASRNAAKVDANCARSDEFELTPTAFRQHGNYTRYSEES